MKVSDLTPAARLAIRLLDFAISLVAIPLLILLSLSWLGAPVAITLKTWAAVTFLKTWFLHVVVAPRQQAQQPMLMMVDPRSLGQ